MSQASPPGSATKVPPPLLDLVLQGRSGTSRRALALELFEGQPGVSRTVGFTAGYLDCSGDLGVGDREHSAFDGWMQEAGKTLPGQGWWSAFLQKFDADEQQVSGCARFADLAVRRITSRSDSSANSRCDFPSDTRRPARNASCGPHPHVHRRGARGAHARVHRRLPFVPVPRGTEG
jgi:hypothetical protein